jgi:hypothetical protein
MGPCIVDSYRKWIDSPRRSKTGVQAVIRISPKEIERLHSRKAQLEKEMRDIERQLRAVAILQGKDDAPSAPGETMLAAIERIVNESPNGIRGKELRKKLQEGGHSIGNYYYTAVQRLKSRKVIRSKAGVLVKNS